MGELLFAVVERREDGAVVVARAVRRRLMVYTTLQTAMTAAKLRRRQIVEQGLSSRAVAWRVVPFAAEGDLAELWGAGEYEHTQVTR